MTTLSQKDTISKITSKGFSENQGGSHRAFNYTSIDGKRTSITTHVSRSPKHKVIDDALISMMASQCHLPRKEFIRFAKCEMDQREYEMHLKQSGKL